jgi:hypothetical protein
VDELNRWLRRQAAREQRAVTLDDALLGDRFWPYAAYRLRDFFARYFAVSAAHAVRVVLLYRVFSTWEFTVIVGAQAAASLAGSFWWGALEAMRGRVRLLYRDSRPHLIPREIGHWLSLSIRLIVLPLAGGVVWIGARAAGTGGLQAVDVYVLAIAVGLAIELPVRCYHSGAYAVRRIYRPLVSLLAVQLVSLSTLGALLPWLGAWSFPVAAMLAAITSASLTFHFTARVYRFFGFAPAARLDLRRVRLPARDDMREFAAAGASYAVLAMDSLLVLALFGTSPGTSDHTVLFVLFFLVGPTVRAGFEWAQLLYFDLKRLEVRVFANLKRRFERYAVRLGLLLGVVFWVLACAIGTAVYGGSLGPFYWLSAPFFVSRSLLGLAQIEAFAERGYLRVLASGVVLLFGIVALRLTLPSDAQIILGLAAVTLLALGVMRMRRGLRKWAGRGDLIWLSEWLARARELEEPVRIRVADLHRPPETAGRVALREWEDGARWLHRRLAEEIARKLGGSGAATVIAPGRIAWYEPVRSARPTAEWLTARCGGFLVELRETAVHEDGPAALQAACRERLLGAKIEEAWKRRGRRIRVSDVERAFGRIVPNGVVYAPDRPAPPLFERLGSAERRLVMFDAALYARDFQPVRSRSRFDVTAFCPAGELRMIFLVDRRTNRRRRARWHATLGELNVRAARLAVAVHPP